MELTPKQQAVSLIKRSNNILITTSENYKGDGIASGLALMAILERLGKKVNFVVSNGNYKKYSFLPGIEKIKKGFAGLRDFIISLSLEKNQVEKITYNIEGDKLNFYISPTNNNFESSDVKFSLGNYKFDAVIVIDSTDLEGIGLIYEMNADLFYDQPVINIDHHSGNDYFGAINFVDITASSTAELLVSIIESIDPKLLDENVATCLLAGIISDTRSFQNSNTTPKSLTITAQLIAAGAKHEYVIKNLYKTKPFDTLKVWGKVLSNIRTDKNRKLLWSNLAGHELSEEELEKEIVTGVLDELLATVPNINVYLLFLEKDNLLKTFIRTAKHLEAHKISSMFGGKGKGQEGEFEMKGMEIIEAKRDILNKISEYLNSSGILDAE